MGKRVMTWLVLTLAVLSVGFVIAGSADHVVEINEAFTCLDGKVASTSLTLEEAVFAAFADVPDPKVNLTINQQRSSAADCWPSPTCTVKATAQVALAKLRQGENVDNITAWLKNKVGVVPELTWYLQITVDNNEPASCVVNYDGVDHSVTIDEEMKISGSPGNCLAISPSGYNLRIAPTCLEKSFNTQCDKGFRTNLLYTKSGGSVTYVSSQTHGASAGAWTLEEISARCFKDSTSCSYEGSLWAATALFSNEEDIGIYAPYLRALASENEKYFPSAFLVSILQGGDEHYGKIMDGMRFRPEGGYWEMPLSPYGKYYDTALAMWALGGADAPEVENANVLGYLFTHQDTTGCWNGDNARDTSFLIFSALWLRSEIPGVCGDGHCTTDETSANCLEDCPLPVYVCGDGVVNGEEACDGLNLSLQNCTTKGFDGGELYCYASNCTFNTYSCTTTVPFEPVCGDNMINGSEVCDCGADLVCGTTDDNVGDETCQKRGDDYAGGNLMCGASCLTYNTSNCYTSGGPPPPGGENQTGNQTNQTGGGVYDPGTLQDCVLAGFFCTSSWACFDAGQTPLPESTHGCVDMTKVCCPVEPVAVSCTSLGGTVCPGDQPCTVTPKEAYDGACCVGGECESSPGCSSDSDCDLGQVCTNEVCVAEPAFECNGDSDCDSGEICTGGYCVSSGGGDEGRSNLWIWIVILAVLIILVVTAIIYRDKLRLWWHQRGSKSSSSAVRPGSPPPGAMTTRRPPPRFGPSMGMRPMMGRAPFVRPGMPRPAPPAQSQKAKSEKEKEDEETLRKLKEMSK
ncbi:MAG: hypothetical protein KKD18_00560 [Nanoarchaeota archaeon]|nr:hypothetical protein [Nanoarchaeota archaeon]